MREITQIHFHHSADESDAKTIEQYHLDKGWGECGYHVIVERDGRVVGMKDDNRPAYSVGNYLNDVAWAICMIGDFTKRNPYPQQWENATAIVREKAKQYGISQRMVLGHREARANSVCPGFSDAMCERFRFDVFNYIERKGEREHMIIPTEKTGLLSGTVKTPYFVHYGDRDMIFVTLSKTANVAAFDLFGKQIFLREYKGPEARIQIPGATGQVQLHITDTAATVQQRDMR